MLASSLATCDITKPFTVKCRDSGEPGSFDIVSAWEVIEHLKEKDLPQFFENVRQNLAPDCLFVSSVAFAEDANSETGAVYHQTVKPQIWWVECLAANGLPLLDDYPFVPADFCRGTANGPMDSDYEAKPNVGFHFVAADRSR